MTLLNINAKKLTSDNFKKYGNVIEATGPSKEINNGISKSWSNLIHPLTFQNELGMNVAILKTQKEKFIINFMERHFFTSQVFVPLGGQKYVVIVAPPDGIFDAYKIEAFIAEGNQGINFHPKTWHYPLMPLNKEMEFLCLMNENKNLDLDIMNLEQEIALDIG